MFRRQRVILNWAAGLALRHRTCVLSQFAAPNDDDRRIVAEEIARLAGLKGAAPTRSTARSGTDR
jgi:hypothetical protein